MNYDALFIGYGQGAHDSALTLAEKGWKVAMIEKSETNYGGSCINIGCIPTKILAKDAERGQAYTDAVARRQEVVEKKLQVEIKDMEEPENITLYTGPASFLDNHRVNVATKDGDMELTADKIIISTGSEPIFPPIEGLKDAKNIHTSTSLQKEKQLPQSLGIIGGGNIGLEFASIYATYGSNITLFESADTFMGKEEPEVADEVKKVLADKGIAIHIGTNVEKVANEDDEVLVTTDTGETFRFNALLVAAGRKPHISTLNLDATDIELTENKGIKTDTHMRTTVDGIYAIGDVRGEEMFTYITKKDGEIVVSDLIDNGKQTLDQRQAIPYATFIEPSFARVGLTEKEARDQGYDLLVNSVPVKATVRSAVIDDERGLFKAVVDKGTGYILGVTLFGDQAHELVNTVKLVMDNDLPYTVLRDQMKTHPVMFEIFGSLFDMSDS